MRSMRGEAAPDDNNAVACTVAGVGNGTNVAECTVNQLPNDAHAIGRAVVQMQMQFSVRRRLQNPRSGRYAKWGDLRCAYDWLHMPHHTPNRPYGGRHL